MSLDDARLLAGIYCPEVTLADDMLRYLVDLSHGSVRRVSVNLVNIQDAALIEGWDMVDRSQWGSRELYTGDAPKRRGSTNGYPHPCHEWCQRYPPTHLGSHPRPP